MARPGFVLEVDERTPPLVVCDGDDFRAARLPLGTRVVYPAESSAASNAGEAIEAALDNPQESEPLAALLRPGMRLTVAFDDLATPVPTMRAPDLRSRILEAVLTRAAAAGVDDVTLVAARGLNRRMSDTELHQILGERVFRSFFADDRLRQHDAESDRLTSIGEADGIPLELDDRVSDADLVIYVHLVSTVAGNGATALVSGLGSTATISAVVAANRSGVDESGLAGDLARSLAAAIPVFVIEAALDNAGWSGPLELLGKREWEWNLQERAVWAGLSRGLAAAPRRPKRRLLGRAVGNYAATAVVAGAPEPVRQASLAALVAASGVEISGAADVGILGVPNLTAYSVNSVTNPVLAVWQGLHAMFGAHLGQPIVRSGGALILYSPLTADFSSLHHPSYVDFYAALEGEGERLQPPSEADFAADPWYRHLYSTGHAFHGVHPFHRWAEIEAAQAHCGDIVWVGGDREVAARLGFRAASTLADALEIVSSSVGRSPSITYLRNPPALIADVR